MKKIVIFIFLIGTLIGCSSEQTKDNEEQKYRFPEIIDYTSFVSEDINYDKVIEKEIEINGYKHKIGFVYSYDMEYLDEGDICNDCVVRNYYVTIILDGNVVKETTGIGMYKDTEEILVDYINLDNLNILKDDSSNVQYIQFYYITQSNINSNYNVMIIDENGTILYENSIEDSFSVTNLDEAVDYIELESNYIHILKMESCEKVYKEKITIENGTIKIENINFDTNVNISGGC